MRFWYYFKDRIGHSDLEGEMEAKDFEDAVAKMKKQHKYIGEKAIRASMGIIKEEKMNECCKKFWNERGQMVMLWATALGVVLGAMRYDWWANMGIALLIWMVLDTWATRR